MKALYNFAHLYILELRLIGNVIMINETHWNSVTFLPHEQ